MHLDAANRGLIEHGAAWEMFGCSFWSPAEPVETLFGLDGTLVALGRLALTRRTSRCGYHTIIPKYGIYVVSLTCRVLL